MNEVETANFNVTIVAATGLAAEMAATTGDEATGSEDRLQWRSAI